MIKIIEKINLREQEYNEYLNKHISNVKKAWNEYLKPNIKNKDLINIVEGLINTHDSSKFDNKQYVAYLNYFYPENKKSKASDLDFDYAWLDHQNREPHHWQYWVLLEDEGKMRALDMPEEHVLCALSDWHSFRYNSKRDYETTEDWYNDNKKTMILSDNTKKLVNKYMKYLLTPKIGDEVK